MNKVLPFIFFIACSLSLSAQELVYNQNPDYAVSRAKYMKIADSLTDTESTTVQDTYKAIDFLADRQEAREARRQFRRQLQLERARHGYFYDGYGYYNNRYDYYRPYSRHRNFYRPGFYNRHNRYSPVVWSTIGSPFFWYWLAR